jgi:glutamate formiminotransferase
MVGDAEWEKFLADEVTPRFPDGFTILKGVGQYREKSGKIISEPSQVLIFLYTKVTKKESRLKIDEIRAAYVKQFSQESVLRMDLRQTVEVSF